MRWRAAKVGEVRIVRKFLWWPMCLNSQTRWLELAYVRQVYEKLDDGAEYWHWLEFVDGYDPAPSVANQGIENLPPRSAQIDELTIQDEFAGAAQTPEQFEPLEFVNVVKTSRAFKDKHAVEILVAMGPKAIPILLRTAQSDLAGVQPLLVKIGPEVAVPALISSLESDNAAMRQMAAVLLWFPFLKPKSHEAVPALIEALKDDDPNLKCAVLRTIGELADAEVSVPLFLQALRDSDATVRASAAAALGKLGQAASLAVPTLRGSLEDEDAAVRDAAAASIHEIGQSGVATSQDSSR